MKHIVKAHLFWIGFGVGVENLVKAVLLQHHLLTITKNTEFDVIIPARQSTFITYQDLVHYRSNRLDKYQKIFENFSMISVTSKNNHWLAQQFTNANITHPYHIKTPTLYTLYTQDVPKLINAGKISVPEKEEIQKSLNVLRLMRRNVDAHSYLKRRTIGSINGDIENIYIPVINLLTNIYER